MICSYDAHIMVVKVDISGKKFIVEQDIQEFCENNEYRYVRHASLHGDQIAFVSEQGKNLNKIVTFKLSSGLVTNLVEVVGGYRFCEFNINGQIYAVKKMVEEGQLEGTPEKDLILTYES